MRTLTSSSSGGECRNPSFGLTTKARGCKVVGQKEGSPGIKAKTWQGCKPKGRKPGSEGKGIGRVRPRGSPRVITYSRESKEVRGSVRE
jgi:hypothetical protein